MGTTEPDAYGPTRNPWDPDRSPGGSSGGSAAAVAARLVPAAHANDIAGSIRIPAAQCGLVGLKPSRGRTLAGRAVDPAVAMNTEGVVTRTMRDTAGLLDAMIDRRCGGPWPPPPLPGPLRAEVGRDPGRLRVGLCLKAFTGADVEDGCAWRRERAATVLEDLGHDVDEDAPPTLLDGELVATSRTGLCQAEHHGRCSIVGRRTLGRELGEEDVEPLTWQIVQAGRARHRDAATRDVGASTAAGP